MPRPFRLAFSLAVIAGLAACDKPATQPATPAAATPAPAASAASPAAPTGSGYTLTMAHVDAYLATLHKLGTMQDAPEDIDDITAMDGSETADQYIARVQADPRARRLITSAGMSVADYAHTSEALLGGMMTTGGLESGALKAIPDGIDPRHVAFVQAHKDEIDAKMAAMQADGGD